MYNSRTSWGALAVASALAASTAGIARADLMAACQTDIASLCAGVPDGRGRISACLFSQSSQLDAACRSEVDAVAKKDQTNFLLPAHVRNLMGSGSPPAVPVACADDEGTICAGVDSGSRNVLACLYAHSANVSAGCASEVETALK